MTARPRLLDLFSGAGGSAVGYHRAGFDVVGVDIAPMPRYPFEFVQADALEYLAAHGSGFDAVHASPPCQDHSALVSLWARHGTGWMLQRTRELLAATGTPYVIENVEGAPMPGAITLCGTEFGLHGTTRSGDRWLKRHRQFESNVHLWGAGGCNCSRRRIGGVYGTGGGGVMTRGYKLNLAESRAVMGCEWMNRAEVSQAIPPAYTEHIGAQLIQYLTEAEATT